MDASCFRQESFIELLKLLEGRFDCVVVSASDMTPVSEVGKCVDAVVIAVASGDDRAGSVRALSRQLEHAGCRVIGGMMYGLPKTRRAYYSVFGTAGRDKKSANKSSGRTDSKKADSRTRRPNAKKADGGKRRPAGTTENTQS